MISLGLLLRPQELLDHLLLLYVPLKVAHGAGRGVKAGLLSEQRQVVAHGALQVQRRQQEVYVTTRVFSRVLK